MDHRRSPALKGSLLVSVDSRGQQRLLEAEAEHWGCLLYSVEPVAQARLQISRFVERV